MAESSPLFIRSDLRSVQKIIQGGGRLDEFYAKSGTVRCGMSFKASMEDNCQAIGCEAGDSDERTSKDIRFSPERDSLL